MGIVFTYRLGPEVGFLDGSQEKCTLCCLFVHMGVLEATLILFCKNTVLLVTTMDIVVKTRSY